MSWRDSKAAQWAKGVIDSINSLPRPVRIVAWLLIVGSLTWFTGGIGLILAHWQGLLEMVLFLTPLGVMMYPGWVQQRLKIKPERLAWVDEVRWKWARVPLVVARAPVLATLGESPKPWQMKLKLVLVYMLALIAIAIPTMAIHVWGLYFILFVIGLLVAGFVFWKRTNLRRFLQRLALSAFVAVYAPILITLLAPLGPQEFYVVSVDFNKESESLLVHTKKLDGGRGEPYQLRQVPQVRFMAIGEAETDLKLAAEKGYKVKALVINVRFSPFSIYRPIVDYKIDELGAHGHMHFKWVWALFGA